MNGISAWLRNRSGWPTARGYSFLEVIAGLIILLTFMTGVFPVIVSAIRNVAYNRRLSQATTLIQRDLDQVKAWGSDLDFYLDSFSDPTVLPVICSPSNPPGGFATLLKQQLDQTANQPQSTLPGYTITRTTTVIPNLDVLQVGYQVTFDPAGSGTPLLLVSDFVTEVMPRATSICIRPSA